MPNPEKRDEPSHQVSGTGCLVRLGWMMFGNAALAICIGTIASCKGVSLSAVDAAFWLIVPILVWLRYIDITRMNGQTAAGQPATMSHWRRYAVLLPALSLIAWVAAHAMA